MSEYNPYELDDFGFEVLTAYIKHGYGDFKMYDSTFFSCHLTDETALLTLSEFYKKVIPCEWSEWTEADKYNTKGE